MFNTVTYRKTVNSGNLVGVSYYFRHFPLFYHMTPRPTMIYTGRKTHLHILQPNQTNSHRAVWRPNLCSCDMCGQWCSARPFSSGKPQTSSSGPLIIRCPRCGITLSRLGWAPCSSTSDFISRVDRILTRLTNKQGEQKVESLPTEFHMEKLLTEWHLALIKNRLSDRNAVNSKRLKHFSSIISKSHMFRSSLLHAQVIQDFGNSLPLEGTLFINTYKHDK